MSALWIAHVTVSDDAAYAKYAALASEAIAAHGGVFLARGWRYVQLEGTDRPRNVVARFPDKESALACYHSETYQKGLDFARIAAKRELVIVEETSG